VDAPHRARVERHRLAQAGDFEPMLHVLRGLGLGERTQVVARDHPLRQLLEVGLREHGAQFRLADQHDLQQLALAGLQVGQQSQLLEHVDREVLRLVDDQHVVLPHGMGAQQVLVQGVDVVLDRRHARPLVLVRDAELAHTDLSSSSTVSLGLKM
jgi:hypothetical protein